MRATAASPDMPAPWMGGVCAGLAVHLGVSAALVRIIMICMTFVGLGFGVYLWLWVTVPEDSPERSGEGTLSPGLVRLREERAAQVSRNRLIVVGVALIVAAIVGTILNATNTLDWRDMGSIITIVSGISLVWSQSRNVSSWRSLRFIGAVFGGIVLLSLGVVMVASRDNPPIILLRGGLIGAALVAGVLFALVPMWLRTTKDLSQAQAQRVRDAERADIAAHLHDSVLQTLTLIRKRADEPETVARLARSQERELRAWLYTDRPAPGTSVADAFTDLAGEIEDRYGVAVDAVCVGDRAPDRDTEVIVAAAREALSNAVRHGAPPVSLYVEASEEGLEVFVRDHGPGFDLDAIAEDRHGVRESIIARMERHGGSARVRRMSTGTEVALTLPERAH